MKTWVEDHSVVVWMDDAEPRTHGSEGSAAKCEDCDWTFAPAGAEGSVCATCDGEREIEQRHPSYGDINCPEPTITVRCPDCQSVPA